MNTKKQNIYIFFLATTIFATACSSNTKIVNDRVSEKNTEKVYTKEKAECQQKAVEVVPFSPTIMPKDNATTGTSGKYTFRDQYGRTVGTATSETTTSKRSQGTVASGFAKAMADGERRRNSYENRIARYRKACLQAKGWRSIPSS